MVGSIIGRQARSTDTPAPIEPLAGRRPRHAGELRAHGHPDRGRAERLSALACVPSQAPAERFVGRQPAHPAGGVGYVWLRPHLLRHVGDLRRWVPNRSRLGGGGGSRTRRGSRSDASCSRGCPNSRSPGSPCRARTASRDAVRRASPGAARRTRRNPAIDSGSAPRRDPPPACPTPHATSSRGAAGPLRGWQRDGLPQRPAAPNCRARAAGTRRGMRRSWRRGCPGQVLPDSR